jgi:hypothetical protein
LALHFSNYSFWVHHLVNWDVRQLLAHAVASDFSVSPKENSWFFVTDQTPHPYPTRSLPTQFWHRCTEWSTVWVSSKPLITDEKWPAEVWTWVSQMTHRRSIHYSTSSCCCMQFFKALCFVGLAPLDGRRNCRLKTKQEELSQDFFLSTVWAGIKLERL